MWCSYGNKTAYSRTAQVIYDLPVWWYLCSNGNKQELRFYHLWIEIIQVHPEACMFVNDLGGLPVNGLETQGHLFSSFHRETFLYNTASRTSINYMLWTSTNLTRAHCTFITRCDGGQEEVLFRKASSSCLLFKGAIEAFSHFLEGFLWWILTHQLRKTTEVKVTQKKDLVAYRTMYI